MKREMVGPVSIEVSAALLDNEDALSDLHDSVQLAGCQLSEWSALPRYGELSGAGFGWHPQKNTTDFMPQRYRVSQS